MFFLDTLITDLHARNYLMDGLFAMYPEADVACKNPAHFFYGTNKPGQVLNPKALSLDLLFSVLESDKLKGGARARNLKAGTKGATALRECGEICAPYIYTIGDTKKAIGEQKSEYYHKLKENKYGKNIDWDKLQCRVRLFYDFMNGRDRLSYAQLLGLAQNMA